jgi:hypothetical protein
MHKIISDISSCLFFLCRAFDTISGGVYRKFLVQSRAAKEDWAFSVQSSVCKVCELCRVILPYVSPLTSRCPRDRIGVEFVL